MISPLTDAAKEAETEGRQAQGKTLRLLAEACDMMLSPASHSTPFKPTLVSGQYRSILPEDFTAQEIEFFAQTVDSIDNPFLKARLSDLVFSRPEHREVSFALAAIDSYMSIPLDSESWSPEGEQCWERAITLSRMLGRGAGERLQRIESLILNAVRNATWQDSFLVRSLSNLLKSTRLGMDDSEAIAEKFASLAAQFAKTGDFDRSGVCYSDAAIWFRHLGDTDRSIAMTVAEAEALVSLAKSRLESEQPSHGVAASFLDSAIQVLRTIPKAKRPHHDVDLRISQLRNDLNEANQQAMAEMATIRTESVDISDVVESSRRAVKGKEVGDALGVLTRLYHARYQKIREAAQQFATNSVVAMMPSVVKSEDGRTVARHPGLSGPIPSDEDETVIQAEMARHYASEVNIAVVGLILPALDVLRMEHRIREVDFAAVAGLSPVVPLGREMLVGKALFLGYDGDFAASLHILCPQIEHIVRFLLKQSGEDTTTLDSNSIQTEKGLSSLMESPKVSELFGEDVTYELRTLFCDKFASNLRNDVAHGLVDDQRSQSVESIYAWWFGMKLVFNSIPWRHAQHEDVAADESLGRSTPHEAEMTTLETLDIAEREFRAGNFRESSRILWQATEATFNLLAEVYGLDPSNHTAVAHALDDKEERKHYYRGYLLTARLLRDHAEMGVLENYELEEPHLSLPSFIRRCHQKVISNGSV